MKHVYVTIVNDSIGFKENRTDEKDIMITSEDHLNFIKLESSGYSYRLRDNIEVSDSGATPLSKIIILEKKEGMKSYDLPPTIDDRVAILEDKISELENIIKKLL